MKKAAMIPMIALLGISQVVLAKSVTITYWGAWGDRSEATEKAICEAFTKRTNGQVIVKPVQMSDVETKVLAAAAGGAAPDLFKIDRFRVGSYAAKNVLMDLTPLITKDKISRSDFFRPCWDENMYGGKMYGMPWNTDSRAMFYNKTLFKQAGLDPNRPPKTWEEMNAAAVKMDKAVNGKMTHTGIVPHNGNWYFLGWLYTAGGDITSNQGRTVAWNSPQGLKALKMMSDYVKKFNGIGALGPGGDFWSGRTGMELNGSWSLRDWNKLKNKKFELGVAAPPRPAGLEGTPMSWAGGFSLAIPRGAKHVKEAWEFIKFYNSVRDNQVTMGVGTGQIPALKSAARDDRFLRINPSMDVFTDILDDAKYRSVTPCGSELWSYYSDYIQNTVITGSKSPEEMLRFTAVEAQKVLDRAWSRVRNR